MSMAVAHLNGAQDHDDQLAGNLCRCTGYAPIIRAAKAAADLPVPDWLRVGDAAAAVPAAPTARMPQSADDLAQVYTQNPDAVLIAGATDVALWVTKGLQDLSDVIFLAGCDDLKQIDITADHVRIGAMANMNQVRAALAPIYPSYAELIRRYGSQQVRNAATLGGNIANGSPIGDNPPALIALGARLHLRQGDVRRDMPIEDFFLAYRSQDLKQGEFVEAVSWQRRADRLKCYKLSKRFDQDISAVCGCFHIEVEDGHVHAARIAFGGVAGIPTRAHHVEAALTGAPWQEAALAPALAAFEKDFQPMDDMRASAAYRLAAARRMLLRYFAQDQCEDATSVLELRV